MEDGSIKDLKMIATLVIPNIKLDASLININPVVYSRTHRLYWAQPTAHRSLNHLLETLSRQVLKAMNLSNSRYQTLESKVIESKEEDILGNSFMAFPFGRHVVSGSEVWTLVVDTPATGEEKPVTRHVSKAKL